MDVKKFDDGDKPYLEWIEAHPNGCVLNTERGVSATYACFHHPDCHFISSEEARQGPNGFTKQKRIKVCADESAALVDWLINNRPMAVANKKSCNVCRPEIEEVSLNLPSDEQDAPQAHEEGDRQTVTVNRYK